MNQSLAKTEPVGLHTTKQIEAAENIYLSGGKKDLLALVQLLDVLSWQLDDLSLKKFEHYKQEYERKFPNSQKSDLIEGIFKSAMTGYLIYRASPRYDIIRTFQSSVIHLEKINESSILNILRCRYATYLQSISQPTQSFIQLSKAFDDAIEVNDVGIVRNILLFHIPPVLNQIISDSVKVGQMYQRGIAYLDKHLDDISIAKVKFSQGLYFYSIGKKVDFYIRLKEVLKIFEKKANDLQLGWIYNEVSFILLTDGNIPIASSYVSKAVDHYETVLKKATLDQSYWDHFPEYSYSQFYRDISQILSNASKIYLADGNFRKAAYYMDETIKYTRVIGDTRSLSDRYLKRSYLASLLKDRERSEHYLFHHMNLPGSGSREYLLTEKFILANNFFSEGNITKAYDTLQLIRDSFPDIEKKYLENWHPHQITDSYLHLCYELALHRKDFSKAHYYLSLIREAENQNKKLLISADMTNILIKYDMDLQNQTINLLKKQTALNVDKSKLSIYLTLGTSAAALVSLFFLLYAYRANKKKSRSYKILLAQNEQLKVLSENLTAANEKITNQTIELQNTNHHLRKLDKFKKTMTSMILNDLRDPLNKILTVSNFEILKSGSPIVDSVTERLNSIRAAGRELQQIMFNALDAYSFEETGVTINLKRVQIGGMIRSSVDKIFFLAEKKEISLEIEVIHGNFVVSLDIELFNRMLINLLTNTIKATPVKGKIAIRAFIDSPQNDTFFIKIEQYIPNTENPIKEQIPEMDFHEQVIHSDRINSFKSGMEFCEMVIKAHNGEMKIEESNSGIATIIIKIENQKIDRIYTEDNTVKSDLTSFVTSEINSSTPTIDFLPEEIEYLAPFAEALIGIEYFEMSDAFAVKNLIEDSGENIQKWKKILTQAILTNNENLYIRVLNEVLKHNK